MFDGETFDAELDEDRLSKQLHRVRQLMRDHKWRTLHEISSVVEAPAQSVSARLRDLRKKKFGGFEVKRRRRGDPKSGVWEYQMLGKVDTPPVPRLTAKQARRWLEALLDLLESADEHGIEVSPELESLAVFLEHRARL